MQKNTQPTSNWLKAKIVCLFSCIWIFAATFISSIQSISPWFATPIILLGLIPIIGFLFAIVLKIEIKKFLTYFIYCVGLGLSYLLIGGVVINFLGPMVGIAKPLAAFPFMLFTDLVVLALTFVITTTGTTKIMLPSYSFPNKLNTFFTVFPLVFIALSVAGAHILNNGGSGVTTYCMLFGVAIYTAFLLYKYKKINTSTYSFALYLISLSLLLMYSLRSTHILGWDINLEYEVFTQTLNHLVWKSSYYPGVDYNACMSITILPTILKQLTHIASEYVFKLTFQFLFAFIPVMVFAFAKKYLENVYAFMSAFLLLSQTWFYEQMPALIRQETAFIFYFLALLIFFDTTISKKVRLILFSIFSVSLIVSHYSTAYVWVAILVGGGILSLIARYIFSVQRKNSLFSPWIVIATIIGLFLWQIPITHTGNALGNFATNDHTNSTTTSIKISFVESTGPNQNQLATSLQAITSTTSPSLSTSPIFSLHDITTSIQQGFSTIIFSKNNFNTKKNLLDAQLSAIGTYRYKPGYISYSDPAALSFIPVIVTDEARIQTHTPLFLIYAISLISTLCKILLIDVFPAVGLIGLTVALRKKNRQEKAETENDTFDLVLLSIAAYVLLLLIVFIPYLQIFYNLTRLYLQMFLVLSTLSILGGSARASIFPRFRLSILGILVLIAFCSSTGALGVLTGDIARITLHTPPSNLDVFYTSDAEISSAHWISINRTYGTPIQADVLASLRLQSYGDIGSDNSAIFPQTIEQNAYVYLNTLNVQRGNAYYLSKNNVLVYKYPIEFLQTHKNLIYSNPDSQIYK